MHYNPYVPGVDLKPLALAGFSLSPCRGGRGCSGSGWGGSGRRWCWWWSTAATAATAAAAAGDGAREEQRLRLSHRAPQFCSHCSRTLRVSASFTSSPQLRRMFTSSTYGLRDRGSERRARRQHHMGEESGLEESREDFRETALTLWGTDLGSGSSPP
ncbi:hypothetical protein EYF80_014008 [Liparis tanakae]|uniref:Uncharacterized protein n=1 Tax=Liparis tanakae TaxID=230148 RepID=A0A4Z2IDM2_9TELE|nr:hypothetical protein EYF80_014008 [Liparis tanakae]